ncbi:MAG: hypothetical protein R3F60_18740 [bacterium]
MPPRTPREPALGPVRPTPDDDPALNLEWFRPDPRPRLYRTYGVGVALILAGALLCGWAFLGLRAPGPEEGRAAIVMIVGLLLTAGGMLLMVRRVLLVLADDTCLVLRVDGLRFDRAGARTLVPWTAIDRVEAVGDRLRIETDDPRLGVVEIGTRFTDLSAAEVARRIGETRRRALMGLLPRAR